MANTPSRRMVCLAQFARRESLPGPIEIRSDAPACAEGGRADRRRDFSRVHPDCKRSEASRKANAFAFGVLLAQIVDERARACVLQRMRTERYGEERFGD